MPNGQVCQWHTDSMERVATMEATAEAAGKRLDHVEAALENVCEQITRANLPQLTADVRSMKSTLARWGAIFSVIIAVLSIFGQKIAAMIFGG